MFKRLLKSMYLLSLINYTPKIMLLSNIITEIGYTWQEYSARN